MQTGADPEFIVRDPAGKPIPAYHFFPREKKLTKQGKSGPRSFEGFFRDGFALEVNGDPDMCQAFMQDSIRGAVKGALAVLPKGYSLDATSMVEVDPEEASGAKAPDDTKTFGCSPSKNAYEPGNTCIPEIDAISHPYRYAGGHLHFSVRITPETFTKLYPDEKPKPWETMPTSHHLDGPYQHVALSENHPLLVKWLDLHVGLPLAVLQAGIPEVFLRRRFYGRAGEYRSQWYEGEQWREPAFSGEPSHHYTRFSSAGIEYRVPGSELWRHNALVSIFVRMGRWTLKNFPKLGPWDPAIEPDLRAAIDLGEGAEKLLMKVNPTMGQMMVKLRGVEELQSFKFPTCPAGSEGYDEAAEKWGVPTLAAA